METQIGIMKNVLKVIQIMILSILGKEQVKEVAKRLDNHD